MTDVADRPGIDFSTAPELGRVIRVDTSRVIVDVTDHSVLTRVSIGNLVAVSGPTASQYLIGLVDRVTRDVQEEAVLEDETEEGIVPLGEAQRDLVRLILVGTYRTVSGEDRSVFKRGADTFPQIDRECRLVEGGVLQQLMGLFAQELDEDERLLLGSFVADPSAAAIADGNRLFQRHAALLGSTGTGKSWAVALILERASRLTYPNLLVFDMHGEYRPLTKPEGGYAAGRRIAGPGDLAEPPDDALFMPYWLLNQEEMLALLLDRSDQNAPNQASRFTTHVRALKQETLERLHLGDAAATFTVDSPIPYRLDELLERLEADDTEMVEGSRGPRKGPYNGTLTRFIGRLRAKAMDRRYGFSFRPPPDAEEYEWLQEQIQQLLCSSAEAPGIKVIDFSEVPSDVLPIVTGVLARTLYDVQFWISEDSRTPITFVCDEAHLYLPVNESADAVSGRALAAFERVAKEGRKYGVSLLVVSQRPSDVSRTILSQCNNFIAMRLTNEQDQHVVRRFTSESMSGLVDVLPLLDVGEALLLGDAMLLPTRVKFDPPAVRPTSATREFWTEWGSTPPDTAAVARGVEALRRQVRVAP